MTRVELCLPFHLTGKCCTNCERNSTHRTLNRNEATDMDDFVNSVLPPTVSTSPVFEQTYPVDTVVLKHFPGHGTFYGKVIDFDPKSKYYKIEYSDGDCEDCTKSKFKDILPPPTSTPVTTRPVAEQKATPNVSYADAVRKKTRARNPVPIIPQGTNQRRKHVRHSRRTNKHKANAARDAPLDPTCDGFHNFLHFAGMGTAINPDTGKDAEYPELICCSNGEYWLLSNDEEVGRLAQGLGPNSKMPSGTNTIWFKRFEDVPKDADIAKVRVVVANRLKNRNPAAFVGWHMVTLSIILE